MLQSETTGINNVALRNANIEPANIANNQAVHLTRDDPTFYKFNKHMPGAHMHINIIPSVFRINGGAVTSYKVVSDREYIIEARINDSFYLINNAVNNCLLSRLAAGF